jgi:hypothetical protein
MGKRQGGIPTERKPSSTVHFDQEIARYLMLDLLSRYGLWVSDSTNGLDACCGKGVLGLAYQWAAQVKGLPSVPMTFLDTKRLTSLPFQVSACFVETDVLTWRSKRLFDVIVCNPPWMPVGIAEEIYHTLYNRLTLQGVLFFVINTTFLYSSVERASRISYNDVVLLNRYTFARSGCPLLDPCVVVGRRSEARPPGKLINIPLKITRSVRSPITNEHLEYRSTIDVYRGRKNCRIGEEKVC